MAYTRALQPDKEDYMAAKKTTNEVYEELNTRVTALEKLVQGLSSKPRKTRKVREYSAEEKAAIRARLLAGQEAAIKRKNENTI
jgi:hypothetical protein